LIIVTGGAGFIGSNIVKALNEAGEDNVLIVDRLGSGEKWQNLSDLKFLDYEHKDDFFAKLQRGFFDSGVRAVFHMGACSSTTEKDADYLMSNNYSFSRELALRLAGKQGLRFIYASSAATYGDGSMGYSDDHKYVEWLRPLNMYGYSKQLFDLWAFRTGFLQTAVGLKYFNVFGPNEYHKEDMRSVAIRAYYQAKKTGTVKLFKSYRQDYDDGEQVRDFIYVKDAVKITLAFLEMPQVNGIFNAGTGTPRSFNELSSAVFSALGEESLTEYVDMPAGLDKRYQYYTCAEVFKLLAAGFKADFMSLEEAVRDYVVNYLEKDLRADLEYEP
jgi:ADP-L-glycero-D-manno-heptose 6-epimerase